MQGAGVQVGTATLHILYTVLQVIIEYSKGSLPLSLVINLNLAGTQVNRVERVK